MEANESVFYQTHHIHIQSNEALYPIEFRMESRTAQIKNDSHERYIHTMNFTFKLASKVVRRLETESIIVAHEHSTAALWW